MAKDGTDQRAEKASRDSALRETPAHTRPLPVRLIASACRLPANAPPMTAISITVSAPSLEVRTQSPTQHRRVRR